MATVLFRGISIEIFYQERPWANKAHLAFQDVEEFRKLIQAGAAHQLAEPCESIRIGQELPIGSAVIGHRTEFAEHKGVSVKSRTFLREQQRPPVKNPCRQCGESNNRQQEWEKADRHHQVKGALAWKESCTRLEGIKDVAHNGIIRCDE